MDYGFGGDSTAASTNGSADGSTAESAGFDAVSSIGMIEHVGASQIDEYAASDRQGAEAGRPRPRTTASPTPSPRFVSRPTSRTGTCSRTPRSHRSRESSPAFERAGLDQFHVENLHADYIETLRQWAERLDQNLRRPSASPAPSGSAVWRLYLRAARNGFETGRHIGLPDAADGAGRPARRRPREKLASPRSGCASPAR